VESLERARLRRRSTTVLIGALLLALGPFLMWQGAEGGPASQTAPNGIVVVGDSITARYNDSAGHDDQGWWSIVAQHYRADVRTYAQSGSGYLRPGRSCTGDRFPDRLWAFTGTPPSIFLIEGGRNDWATCVAGRFVTATDAQIQTAVERYMDLVKAAMPMETHVMVLAPWGPKQAAEGLRVTEIIRTAAAERGFEFIDTAGALGPDQVSDGVHPNRAGSLAIADRVIAAIG